MKSVLAVAAGGVIGTGLRLLLDTLVPHTNTSFPLSTLVVNIVGGFTLALLTGSLFARKDTPDWLRAGLGAGLLGSFTTMSAVMVSIVAQITNGAWLLAVAYLILTVLAGITAAVLGFVFAIRLFGAGSGPYGLTGVSGGKSK